MSVFDIGMTADGSDIDFSDALVTGLPEYRQAVFLRLSHDVTFTDADFGLDLAGEIGSTGAATLGVRASAAIMNDPRFTATLTTPENQQRRQVGGIVEIRLAFDILVDETQETFSLDVLIANGTVQLVPIDNEAVA